MADQGSADTFEHTIGGRVMVFKTISKSQIIMLRRYVNGLQSKANAATEAKNVEAIFEYANKINEATWSTIESQFTDPADLEWIQLEIIAGRIDEQDLLPLLSNGYQPSEPPDDDADPAPAKRAGRKAPAAKKAAKKAAPARRATR